MTYNIIDKNNIEIDKYIIKILYLIYIFVYTNLIITLIYNIQLF